MFCIKKKIPILVQQGRIKLVIIDSVAALFRCSFELKETMQRAKVLSSLAATLHHLSRRHSLCVVCINQVLMALKMQTHLCNICVLGRGQVYHFSSLGFGCLWYFH